LAQNEELGCTCGEFQDNIDARHGFAADFVQALADDWKQFGVATIQKLREQDPRAYVEAAVKIIPRELLIGADRQEPKGPQNSREIADALLGDFGLSEPSDNDREKALAAYDEMNVKLEQIAYEALH
jgi:hypothetical protein